MMRTRPHPAYRKRRQVTDSNFRWPPIREIWPDLAAFVLGLAIAGIFGWKTTDLVWSLWLCSLVLGYLTILSTIGGGVLLGIVAIRSKDFLPENRPIAILLGTIAAVFFLGFFSLHFCGFHAGHATFLLHFFPLQGVPKNAFFDAFTNPFLLWKTVIVHLLPVYGLFLIPAIIAERKYVFASLLKTARSLKDGTCEEKAADMVRAAKSGKRPSHDPFSRPYINVIRMHLLIFFFAFCFMLKVQSFVVYAVVYLVYFFPWRAFRSGSASAAEEAKLPEGEVSW